MLTYQITFATDKTAIAALHAQGLFTCCISDPALDSSHDALTGIVVLREGVPLVIDVLLDHGIEFDLRTSAG